MRASYRWLRELTGIDASAEEFAKALTRGGVEVEGMERRGEGLDRVVVAEVRDKKPHPTKDGLTLVTVFDGAGLTEVVCGASNVPAPGGRVLFAQVGAKLPGGMEIAERKVAGVLSRGMLASEAELGIGDESDGIFVCSDREAAPAGTPIREALDLADVTFEINLTPNRPDCLGHRGLAREIAIAWGKPLPAAPAAAQLAEPAERAAGGVTVEILDSERCPRYGAAVVRGVRMAPSPFGVRYRLHNLGVRSISNVVDVTNLVMLEWGHPIHAFDLPKLRGGKVIVRLAQAGEVLRTLDGAERKLTTDDLLIADAEGGIALAGVMGGADSGISDATSDVLIECAYFDPRSVRRTSRRVGLHTDASHRFERGVDPSAVPAVLRAAVHATVGLAGGAADPTWIDAHPRPEPAVRVTLRAPRLAAVLGYAPPPDAVTRYLSGIGGAVEAAADGWRVTLPTHRPDLTREIDLIEEVARLHGYHEIPTRAPRVRPAAKRVVSSYHFHRAVRRAATGAGFHEAVTYAFVDAAAVEKARVPVPAERLVRLENPLSEERNVLRPSLLPGLLECVKRAQHHQAEDAQLAEVGRVFAAPTGETRAQSPFLADETVMLGVVLAGRQRDWVSPARAVDFYDLKGALDAVVGGFSRLRLAYAPLPEARAPFLHPRRAAVLAWQGEDVGVAGMLHPDVADAFGLHGAVAYAELSAHVLEQGVKRAGTAQASPLPAYPASRRDIALLVDAALAADAVHQALVSDASPLVESVELFDLYAGSQVPAGKKSLAFRVTYRDPAGTLTDERVDAAHAELRERVRARIGAETR